MEQKNLCLYESLGTAVQTCGGEIPDWSIVNAIITHEVTASDLKQFLIHYFENNLKNTSLYQDTLNAWESIGSDPRRRDVYGDIYMVRIFVEAIPCFRVHVISEVNGVEFHHHDPYVPRYTKLTTSLIPLCIKNIDNNHWICSSMSKIHE